MKKEQYIKPTVKTVAFTIEHGYAGTVGPDNMTPTGNETLSENENVFTRGDFF
jgi:hypothetical protein